MGVIVVVNFYEFEFRKKNFFICMYNEKKNECISVNIMSF